MIWTIVGGSVLVGLGMLVFFISRSAKQSERRKAAENVAGIKDRQLDAKNRAPRTRMELIKRLLRKGS